MSVHVYIYIMFVNVCTFMCVNVCVHVCVCTYMCVNMYVHVFVTICA